MKAETSEPRWAGNILREVALTANGTPSFWNTAEGKALIRQLDRFISPVIAREVRSTLRYAIDPDEVTNTIVLQMSSQESFIRGVREAVNPWGYLLECGKRWARKQAGHRVLELDALVGFEPTGGSVEELFDPASGLTPVDEVIASTVEVVAHYCGSVDRASLEAIVRWFALNPPQHRGHGHTEARTNPELRRLGFTVAQVGVLANVTWGARPEQQTTSLFYGFLRDAQFKPHTSRTHRMALTRLGAAFSEESVTDRRAGKK